MGKNSKICKNTFEKLDVKRLDIKLYKIDTSFFPTRDMDSTEHKISTRHMDSTEHKIYHAHKCYNNC